VSAQEALLHYQSLLTVATSRERHWLFKKYSQAISDLVEETYSRPYSDVRVLLATLQHVSSYLQLCSIFPNDVESVRLDRHVLRIVEQAVDRQEHSLVKLAEAATTIYNYFSAAGE